MPSCKVLVISSFNRFTVIIIIIYIYLFDIPPDPRMFVVLHRILKINIV